MANDNTVVDHIDDELETVNESGKPVKERVASVEAARSIYDKLIDASRDESHRRAVLKGLVDGNPPYNATRLRELGMGHRINVNFLEARAIINAKSSAFFELFFEVPTLVEAKLLLPQDPNIPAPDFGQIVAEEFSRTLFKWSGFLVNMMKSRKDSDIYGLGGQLFSDEWDWRPKAFDTGNFLPDPKASLDIEELEIFALRDSMSAGELYRKAIENEEAAREEGWNPAAVKRLLIAVYKKDEDQTPDGDTYQTSVWESVQQRIRNNEWTVQAKEFEQVKVIHLCVREVSDGKVSHYIMSERQDPGRDEFLFRKLKRFEKMSHVLWWLPYEDGDNYLRSCRGLASMIQPHCDLSNRYLCQVFDAGFLVGSMVLQPKTAMDAEKLQIVRAGPITMLPPGLDAVQSSFQPRMSDLIQLRDLSTSIMRNNTGVFRQHPENYIEKQPQKTARQVIEEVAKEARVEKSNVAYDYVHIERLYREMFRRIVRPAYLTATVPYGGQDLAREFVARCLSRGVPEELLLNAAVWEIHVTRAIGMGSWGVKMDLTNQLLQARPLFDEQGQIQAIRDWLAVRVGQQNVDKYKALRNRDQIPSNEHSIATLENNDMMEGSSVPVGSDQVHAIHAMTHIPVMVQIMQQYTELVKSGDDRAAGQVVQVLSVMLPHMQETVQYLAQDPSRKPMVDQIVQVMQQAAQVLRDAVRRVQQQQKLAQQAQAEAQEKLAEADQVVRSRETDVKMYEIQQKTELERLKQESLNDVRSVKSATQLDIRRQQAQADIALKAARQAEELALAREKVDADIELKRRLAAGGTEE